MKKIFTHLFALFLLSFVTTSNVWAETIELDPSAGTFSGGNSSYCNTWTSNSEPVVTFSVAVNNMTVGAVNGGFGIARGQNADSNWTFSVAGYKILSYSFNYKLQDNSAATDIVITVNNEAHAVTTTSQLLEVNDVNASAASFTLSGTNETIILTDVTIEAEPILKNGAVYRFVCSGTTTVSLGASALTDVAAVSTSETEKAQQWYVTVSDNNYTFRNLANGRYLQGNNTTSGSWALTEASNNFTVTVVNGNYAIRGASHSNGYGYMHKDGSNNIVSWESGAANSQWTPIEVSYTAEELQAVWDEVEALVVPSSTVAGYQEKLNAIFSDKACTKLNDTYAGKTLADIQADANYTGLPAVLQAMVVKVYNEQSGSTTAWAESTVAPADRPNGNNNTNHDLWTVADTWENDYAKKFRVQMYEPYSVEGEITSYLRINAHCNMDNPTGIYANAGEPMYIMVEGTIDEGAELWVAHQVGHGATMYYNNAAYTQLHEGLNVVPYFANGSQLWINYVVHTYDADGATIAEKFPEDRQLSKYKPLKIHIEGGKINGFFNAMGDYRSTEVSGDANGGENLWGDVDNDEDWNYYKARAALSGDFALLGHRQTLLFDFGTWNSTKGHFCVANADGGIEYALAYHLEDIEVPTTPNCYGGTRGTFGTFAGSYPNMNLDAENGTINIMLEAWDRIQYSEHASLGLLSVANIEKMNALYPRWTTAGEAAEIYNYGEATINNVTQTYQQFCQGIDYSEYFNHHGAAVGAGSGYMSGGWRVCNYHYNTMGSIIGKIAVEPGPTWGPAHEIGHQHQTIFNLNGQTEVTNNFHSNVAVWYMGMGTSRYNGSNGSLESVLAAYNTDGNDLYTNNIWALTHLYYRLWLYYHLAGNNTQFWPRLFELLRQVPIVNGGQISGETSLLRFYRHACDAAGEDLTEFFRAHGFFELMTDRLVGDYSNATYNVTEEQIETAISAVKAKGYPNNYAIILINDGTSETTVKHDGDTPRSLWDSNATAEYGSVNDFIEGNTEVETAYTATVSANGTVTMSGGTGGVGFLIFNEEGEIVSFSNKSTFEISDEAAYLLATGKASIVAVDAESNTTESEVDLSAIQREMLKALIEKIEAMPIDDGSYTHVGFYTNASATELLAALESANAAYESGSGYGAAYEMLYAEKEKFVNSQNLSFVPFDPSLTYVITNYAYGKTMYLNSNDNYVYSNTNIDQEAATAQWQFKTTDTEGVYKVYNTNGTGSYLPKVVKSTHLSVVSDEASAVSYVLRESTPVGTWTISLESPDDDYPALHDNSFTKVVGWDAVSSASKWYLRAVENSNSASLVAADELQALIAKTETLVDLVGEISYTVNETPVALQVTNASNDFYVRTNATNTAGNNEGPIANLVDGSTGNYFHTQWGNNAISDDGLDHYIEVSMGNGALSAFSFSYTTRAGVADDYPQIIKVYGSNTENKTGDESEYVLLATVSSGLPASSTQTTYTYPTAIDAGIAYKYLRFMVPTTNKNRVSGGSQHNYWHMAEFDISAATAVATPRTDYSSIDAATILAAYNALNAAKSWVKYEKLTSEQLATAKSNLETAYDALKEAYDAVLNAKRTELQTLIESTTTLINGTATVTPGTEEKVTLTTTAGSAGYLYCNAQIFEGSLGNLLVDDNTFMHTHWGTTTSADHDYHYLRVDMGEGNTIGEFSFTYTTASRVKKDMPAEIVVEGANEIDSDNSTLDTFTPIATLTSLPEVLNTYSTYTSRILGDANTPYRYLRFKVTKNNCGELDGDSHPFFTMTRFGLTKITPATATVKDTYLNTEATPELVLATYNENSNAAAMKNIATSMAMLQTQIDKLQAAYNALETARETSATPDKTALEELIAATTILKNRMYEIESYTANEITLQNDTEGAAGYLYCNAAGSTNNYSGDNLGVDALLDNDTNTSNFLHTTYYGNDNKDGLDHYLRVDLGESKEYIRFRYKGRSGYAALTPKNAVVQATNDLSGEWTNIATLYGLTQTTDEVSTACLGNGVAYRYWRFMVTATYDGRKHDGHPYYALSAFNVDVCTDVVISSQLKSEYNPEIYIYTTSTLVTEVENAITEAETVVDNEGASQTDVNSEVEALQAVYDKLEEALKYAGIPVVITTDEENPVLYRIISKRADDDSYVLQFDEPTTNKVKIVNPVDNSSYQAWYFMQGEYGYLIKPFNGCGKVLSVESTGDGSAKANIAEESENIYSEWNFSRSAVTGCTDYFYIYVNGTSHACFSHNGNFVTTDKMGIWASGWNTNDGGSLFKFVEAEFDNDNARYYQLSDFENTLEYQTADTPEGTTVGAFVNGTAYGTAYSTASTLIEAGNTSATADCYAAYTALREESKTVKKIIPEAGKYYRIDITPGLTDSRAGASMRVDENGKLACGEYAAANASYIFTFEYDADDNLYMKNLHTATYVDEAPAHNTKTQVGADAESITDAESNAVVAKSISINTLGKSGEAVVVGITPNGGAMLNCAAKVGNVVAFDNTAVDKASAWVITEVALEDIVENIEYSATLGADQTATEPVAYSTLYLSYNATIPGDVTASIVEEIDGDGQLVLVPVTGGILPANTAVVLSQENEGNVVFEYTDEESEFDTEGNILKGTSFTRYVECGDESNIYVLSRKNGHMAFYWAYENRDANGDYVYINANEEIVEKTAEGAHKNHNKGGWVKCNANKSYLQVDEGNGVAAAAMFSFLVGGNTTDIESINAVADEYGNVYDLQGRKLTEITSPGLYIVNGKKVYVK